MGYGVLVLKLLSTVFHFHSEDIGHGFSTCAPGELEPHSCEKVSAFDHYVTETRLVRDRLKAMICCSQTYFERTKD